MESRDAVDTLARLHHAQNAFYAGGDVEPLRAILTPDVHWTIPGDNAIAGTYRGLTEVVEYFRRRRQLANSTFQLHPGDVLVGAGDRVVSLTDGSGEFDGVVYTWSTVGLYDLRDRHVAACWLLPLDPTQFDLIWRVRP